MSICGVYMLERIRCLLFLGASISAMPVVAQQADPASATPQVVVTGKQTDTEARRDFVAGKIIIGRKKIEESGAENVAELLKREPSVSISANGQVGLLGMPGYTQVLVDGGAPPPGKGLSQLNLVHVEKIEIVKSAIAEYGPFGIAGTINIITRKTARKSSTQLGLTGSHTGGEPSARATLSHHQSQEGSPLRFSANLSASQGRSAIERRLSLASSASPHAYPGAWGGSATSLSRNATVEASGELNWEIGNGHTLVLSPNGGQFSTEDDVIEARHYVAGTDAAARIATDSVLKMENFPLSWSVKLGPNNHFEMRARFSRIGMDVSEVRAEDNDSVLSLLERTQGAMSHVTNLETVFKAKLKGGHDIKLGASELRTREAIRFDNLIDGKVDTGLAFLGGQTRARSKQSRIYAQDDWRMSESFAVNAGLSAQQTSIDLDEGAYDSTTRFRLWSPSLHLLKDTGDDDNTRQWRLSVARTYRAPHRNDLALRPRVNPLAPCTLDGCAANTIDTLDTAGNAALRPESSLGLNLSYEHGIGADSTLTIEVYSRRIGGKIGTEISLEDVPWSTFARYVSRPANLGNARVAGVNLEMGLALRDASKSAPKVHLRGNINFSSSRVSNLEGPDNRIDKQTPWSAKLGGSYNLQSWPLKFDLDGSWSPGVWIRSNPLQRIRIARRFDLEGSLAWSIVPGSRLRLSVSDIAARTAQSIHEFGSAQGLLELRTDTRTHRTVTLRFDTKI